MSDAIDTGRRRFLTAATGVVGAVGAAGVAVPFLKSWNPSARAQAAGAPVEADISKLEPGALLIVEWRSKPVWIIRRSPELVERLGQIDDLLRDPISDKSVQPEYVKNPHRARDAEVLVMIGICTHLGCSPNFRPVVGSVDESWPGGFLCPCHGSKFDLAGRVFKGVPAPLNMEIPPHVYLDDAKSRILIGVDEVPA